MRRRKKKRFLNNDEEELFFSLTTIYKEESLHQIQMANIFLRLQELLPARILKQEINRLDYHPTYKTHTTLSRYANLYKRLKVAGFTDEEIVTYGLTTLGRHMKKIEEIGKFEYLKENK